MKKILLVYPPFCTPASPPYSITNIASFLKKELLNIQIIFEDLNQLYHNQEYKKEKTEIKKCLKNYNQEHYQQIIKNFLEKTKKDYAINNKKVIEDENPKHFEKIIKTIISKKPEIVCISIVYSSQIFYTLSILKELKKQGIISIIGGPSTNEKIIKYSNYSFKNKEELKKFIETHIQKKQNNSNDNMSLIQNYTIDFSHYNKKDYFTNNLVIPIKTSNTCYYKKCTFCTHFSDEKYIEFNIKQILETIIKSKQKNFFIIDDMLSKKRLLEIAEIIKPQKINFMCQLKPTKDYDEKTLNYLHKCGLKAIIFGIESASDKILESMKKNTKIDEIKEVLKASHKANIKNIAYIMFGFPKETKEDFLKTIEFLKQNEKYIDLISTSVFGLNKDSYIYKNPKEFGITKIIETKRTYLNSKLEYENNYGLSTKEAKYLRNSHKRTLEKINKYPKEMNFFREHMLSIITSNKKNNSNLK